MSDRDVIEWWKDWHRELSSVLGCRFVTTNITMKAAIDLKAQLDETNEKLSEFYCWAAGLSLSHRYLVPEEFIPTSDDAVPPTQDKLT
jgi:hypothetical protein